LMGLLFFFCLVQQVLLGAADLAAETGRETVYVLILSKCRPIVNLFPCGELLEHRDEGWLYRMDVEQLRKRTSLPIGTCQLSIHLSNKFYAGTKKTSPNNYLDFLFFI
jgi:hypothetical protein